MSVLEILRRHMRGSHPPESELEFFEQLEKIAREKHGIINRTTPLEREASVEEAPDLTAVR